MQTENETKKSDKKLLKKKANLFLRELALFADGFRRNNFLEEEKDVFDETILDHMATSYMDDQERRDQVLVIRSKILDFYKLLIKQDDETYQRALKQVQKLAV